MPRSVTGARRLLRILCFVPRFAHCYRHEGRRWPNCAVVNEFDSLFGFVYSKRPRRATSRARMSAGGGGGVRVQTLGSMACSKSTWTIRSATSPPPVGWGRISCGQPRVYTVWRAEGRGPSRRLLAGLQGLLARRVGCVLPPRAGFTRGLEESHPRQVDTGREPKRAIGIPRAATIALGGGVPGEGARRVESGGPFRWGRHRAASGLPEVTRTAYSTGAYPRPPSVWNFIAGWHSLPTRTRYAIAPVRQPSTSFCQNERVSPSARPRVGLLTARRLALATCEWSAPVQPISAAASSTTGGSCRL